jgi:signal peptidase I
VSTVVLALASSTIAALAAYRLRRVLWLTRVTSWSMYPTLRPGQRVVTRGIRRDGHLHRGDVVVADSAELGRRIIKRVVGLPGDRVDMDAHGLTVNTTPTPEPYVRLPGGPAASFVVPHHTVLLLGDNRSASHDSRSWEQPFLPFDSIKGRVRPRRPTRGPHSFDE